MATFAAACPACSTKLKVPDTVKPGTRVKCPKCANPFAIPAQGDDFGEMALQTTPARRNSRVENYGSGVAAPTGEGLDGLPTKYKIDIVGLFRLAWANVWSVVLPMFGFSIVLSMILPFTILTLFIVLIPLMLGPQIVALAQLKGEPWGFGDFFRGFKFFGALIVFLILAGLTQTACMLPGSIVAGVVPSLLDFSQGMSATVILVLATVAIVLMISFLVTAYVSFRITFFAPALIFDQGMGGLDALKGSWRLTGGNLVGVFLLAIVMANIIVISALLFYLPLLVGYPLIILMHNAAYLAAVGKVRVPD